MFRVIALVVVALLVGAGAWFGRPDQAFLARQLVQTRLEPALRELVDTASSRPVRIAWLADEPPPPLEDPLASDVDWVDASTPADQVDHTLDLRFDASPHSVTLHYAIDGGPAQVHAISGYAVLPPLLAIVTAILFRHVLGCLTLGVLAGGVIAVLPTGQSPVYGLWHAFYAYFIRHAVLDEWRLEITAFILLISATVGLARQSGGIQGLIDIVVRYCRTPRSARVGTAVAGLLVFFDDYLNCIIVGNTLRPLTDRHRVSRAKLAYIVDSTAAPLAGLAVFSTWIAFEISQIEEGLTAARIGAEPFAMFVHALPTRFYCIFTVVMVFALAWTGRDYGPMHGAEREAASQRREADASDGQESVPVRGRRARFAVVPIGLTLVVTVIGLWWSGWTGADRPAIGELGATAYIRAVLARTDSMWAFSRAAGIGFITAVAMIAGARVMTPRQIVGASLSSVRVILKAVAILFLAWSLGGACKDVGTAPYLVSLFREVISPVGFAVVVFLLSCLVAFSTGSSYSTMAILLPNVVPLAFAVGEHSALTGLGLTAVAVGAVLDGAIFGDHCSPISDTTILSALSSQCDTIDHVRTQMPYAVTAMLIALAAGYIPVALGVPAWCSGITGAAAVVLIVRFVGRPVTGPAG